VAAPEKRKEEGAWCAEAFRKASGCPCPKRGEKSSSPFEEKKRGATCNSAAVMKKRMASTIFLKGREGKKTLGGDRNDIEPPGETSGRGRAVYLFKEGEKRRKDASEPCFSSREKKGHMDIDFLPGG